MTEFKFFGNYPFNHWHATQICNCYDVSSVSCRNKNMHNDDSFEFHLAVVVLKSGSDILG